MCEPIYSVMNAAGQLVGVFEVEYEHDGQRQHFFLEAPSFSEAFDMIKCFDGTAGAPMIAGAPDEMIDGEPHHLYIVPFIYLGKPHAIQFLAPDATAADAMLDSMIERRGEVTRLVSPVSWPVKTPAPALN